MMVFVPSDQITALHARHKRTLFCREPQLVSLSGPQLFNIVVRIKVFHVNGGVVFEVSFLEAYDCWVVFCDKKIQFTVVDPCSFDVPLDYFIHLVRFSRLFWLRFVDWSFIFNLHFFDLFKFVWRDYWGGLCLSNSFSWVLFFNGNIFHFIFIYIFVNVWRLYR